MKLKYIAILLATILVATVAAYTVDYLLKLDTSGTYTGSLVASPTSIYWGNMSIGVPVSYLVNITNTGTRNFTNLNVPAEPLWSVNVKFA